MNSMTGYGSARLESPLFNASLAIKSWNNRYLELSVNMPAFLAPVEQRVRELLASLIGRGKVELSVRVSQSFVPMRVTVDSSAAQAMAIALRQLARDAGIDASLSLSNLMAVDGLMAFERDADEGQLWSVLEPALSTCLKDFQQSRQKEGEHTAKDMEAKLAILEDAVLKAQELAPSADAAMAADLRKRFVELLGDAAGENRILAETAAYLAKHTINEELVRLRFHLDAFRSAMTQAMCGKKLDFICQELNREANTIGSKSSQFELSSLVIAMKDAIENLREQVRNVE